jgi:hypothetical protein
MDTAARFHRRAAVLCLARCSRLVIAGRHTPSKAATSPCVNPSANSATACRCRSVRCFASAATERPDSTSRSVSRIR